MELDTASSATRQHIGTRSAGKVPSHDGRSWQALFRKRLRASLLQHLGGRATITQNCLIDAAVDIALELEVMRRRRDENGGLTMHDARAFLAYQNTFRRHLLALGFKATQQRTTTLRDYLQTPQAAA
jgi:hypothetical protein